MPKERFLLDLIFGGSCILKLQLLEDSPVTGVLQVAQKIKRAKIWGQYGSPEHKECNNWGGGGGVDSTETGKIWLIISVN